MHFTSETNVNDMLPLPAPIPLLRKVEISLGMFGGKLCAKLISGDDGQISGDDSLTASHALDKALARLILHSPILSVGIDEVSAHT